MGEVEASKIPAQIDSLNDAFDIDNYEQGMEVVLLSNSILLFKALDHCILYVRVQRNVYEYDTIFIPYIKIIIMNCLIFIIDREDIM